MSNKKEIWKAIKVAGKNPTVPYVISNHGRFGVMTDGKVDIRTFKPTAGSYRYNIRQRGTNKAIFLAKEVAGAFLKKPSPKYKFIIHKDHNYLNDDVDNLKWSTHEEHRAHTALSPRSILARQKKAITTSTHAKVLNEKSVTALKKMIWDPKRKLSFKQLAEKFGVSEMQIYRIKTGEFWYHIRVENEPLHPKYKQNLSNISYQEKKEAKETGDKEKARAAREAVIKKNAEKRAKAAAESAKKRKALEITRAKNRKLKEAAAAKRAKVKKAAEAKRKTKKPAKRPAKKSARKKTKSARRK